MLARATNAAAATRLFVSNDHGRAERSVRIQQAHGNAQEDQPDRAALRRDRQDVVVGVDDSELVAHHHSPAVDPHPEEGVLAGEIHCARIHARPIRGVPLLQRLLHETAADEIGTRQVEPVDRDQGDRACRRRRTRRCAELVVVRPGRPWRPRPPLRAARRAIRTTRHRPAGAERSTGGAGRHRERPARSTAISPRTSIRTKTLGPPPKAAYRPCSPGPETTKAPSANTTPAAQNSHRTRHPALCGQVRACR